MNGDDTVPPDDDLEQNLRQVLRDPPPASLDAASFGLLSWLSLDDELADLEHAAQATPALAGVRGAGDVTTFTFTTRTGELVELEFEQEPRRLIGQFVPARIVAVLLQHPSHPDRRTESSSRGVFSFEDVAPGPMRLVFGDEGAPPSRQRTRWVVL
jgi:hypothetical protein